MKMHIVVIRDIKANVYGAPMFVGTIGGAIRSFGDECQKDSTDNMLSKHPEDFELFKLGEYDDATAQFELTKDREQLAVGANYKR